jgi:hypothetical protein
VFDQASDQEQAGQPGIPGDDALLQQAILQLKPDICGEVFQVKLAGDRAPRSRTPCGSMSAVSRLRKMSRITLARQVRDSPQDRIAASSMASSSTARSSHSPRTTCSTSDCSTEVNPSPGTSVTMHEL